VFIVDMLAVQLKTT